MIFSTQFALLGLVFFGMNAVEHAVAQSTNKPAEKPAATAPPVKSPRLLVKVKKGVNESDLTAFEKARNVKTVKNFSQINGLRVIAVPPGVDPAKLAAEYKQSGLVEYAELDQKVRAFPSAQ